MLEAERLFFAQKATGEFQMLGDRCSKFFHDLIKRNNKRNLILAITKRDRVVTSCKDESAAEFVGYFKQRLGQSVTEQGW